MAAGTDIGEFLTSRRAKVSPQQAGLRSHGQRRVPGLRREEVAALAGVSVEYYRRLERGQATGVSDSVLEALSQALELDDAERAHLRDLARTANPAASAPRRPPRQRIRPTVQRVLDSMTTPAIVHNPRSDFLAANAMGRALYAPMFDGATEPPNSARFVFLDSAAADFYPDWEQLARDLAAHLRKATGANPDDRALADLVGELCARSEAFRTLWAARNVRFHLTGLKRFDHPVAGALELSYEKLPVAADSGLTMTVYTAEPGSASQQALDLLGSWAAAPDEEAPWNTAR